MSIRDGVILVITSEFDPHADRVIELLAERHEQVFRFHPADFPIVDSLCFQIRNGNLRGVLKTPHRTLDLTAIKSAWYRRPQPFQFSPSIPENELTVAKSETNAAIGGLYSIIDCLWVNSPLADRAASIKLRQLREATIAGLTAPKTVVTMDPREVLEFYDECGGKIIYKTLGSLLPVFSLSKKMIFATLVNAPGTDLASVTLTPCLFQEYVEKDCEFRITVVGNRVLACEIQSQRSQNPATHIDWRHYSIHDTPHRAVELPPRIHQACLKLVHRLGLCFGAIDMIRRPDGEYVFLEINPSGQFGWIEGLTGLPIYSTVADLLAAGSTSEYESRWEAPSGVSTLDDLAGRGPQGADVPPIRSNQAPAKSAAKRHTHTTSASKY